jgi:hypothetical protein
MAVDQVDPRIVIKRSTAVRSHESAAAPSPRSTYRATAKVVGALYLGGFVVGIGGSGLIQSILGTPAAPAPLSAVAASSTMLAFAGILWLVAVAGDAAHGILMFPVLRPHNERIAVGYLAARILDAAFIAVMTLFVLLQIPVASAFVKAAVADAPDLQVLSSVLTQGQLYAYDIGMITLGLSGLMLNFTLYRARLIPPPLAIWGLVGYAVISVGMISEVLGSGLGLASSIPGGLWEVFIGGWLIAKGFSSSPAPADSSTH